VARLNALPYSTTCVKCAREIETDPSWGGRLGDSDWEKLSTAESSLEDQREVDLSDLEVDLSK
jgi:DnaK suppressor protein